MKITQKLTNVGWATIEFVEKTGSMYDDLTCEVERLESDVQLQRNMLGEMRKSDPHAFMEIMYLVDQYLSAQSSRCEDASISPSGNLGTMTAFNSSNCHPPRRFHRHFWTRITRRLLAERQRTCSSVSDSLQCRDLSKSEHQQRLQPFLSNNTQKRSVSSESVSSS